MIVTLVAALDLDGTIGAAGELPWRLPADLKRFRSLTIGKPVVMGRRTHESIGRPLPKRTNVVLSTRRDYAAEGCIVVHSVDEALSAASSAAAELDEPEVMIIGGAIIYALFLPRANRFHLTLIHARVPGDTRFPSWNPSDWRESFRERHAADEGHEHPFSFITLERARSGVAGNA